MHSTIDLFQTYLPNTLPIRGVIYYTLMVAIKKSVIANTNLLPKYSKTTSTTRQNGQLQAAMYRRKNRVGTESSYLGVILFNQLPTNIREIQKLERFKLEVKKYLLDHVEKLLKDDQLKTRRI